MYEQDTEFTISTGKLLGIFFGLVAVCGIFFSLGYAVGRNSTPAASTVIMDSAQVASVQASGGTKPAPRKEVVERPCAPGTPGCEVEEEEAPAAEQAAEATPPPEFKPGSGYMVQVAAVSKQEDADALVNALRRKQYPVLVVPNATSQLFHVQVGPFAEQREAEAMRTRLAGDGYNAILKK
jgi:DedD protein